MDWKDCKDKKFVKSISGDDSLVDSLIKFSDKKIKSDSLLKFSEVTSSTKISILYESLREILEALAIKKGYKIYNHECFCSFLYEVCGDKAFSKDFDRFRKLRNKINYYGKDISVNDAKFLAKDIIELRSKIIKKYF